MCKQKGDIINVGLYETEKKKIEKKYKRRNVRMLILYIYIEYFILGGISRIFPGEHTLLIILKTWNKALSGNMQ